MGLIYQVTFRALSLSVCKFYEEAARLVVWKVRKFMRELKTGDVLG